MKSLFFYSTPFFVDEVKMFEASQKQRLPGCDRHPDPLEKRMIRPALDVQALNI